MLPSLALLSFCPPAGAVQPGADVYRSAVRFVDQLYLGRDRIDEVELLRSAARGLESSVHWLRVSAVGRSVILRHGDGSVLGTVEVTSMDDLPRALAALEELVGHRGVEDVDLRLSVLGGMADALDRYSRVLADERLARFNVRLSGTLVGIGATFRLDEDRMYVHRVQPDGPAAEGGLVPGDEVLRIDGRSTVNMPLSEATRRLRGDDGTQVVVQVQRDGRAVRAVLTRAVVTVPNVSHRVLEDNVGYVHIDHISQRTVENLRAALDRLVAAGALDNGLVVDLRNNTGGSMREAARLADVFLDHGLLLRTVGRDGGRVQNLESEMRAGPSSEDLDVPLVLVVNGLTASGSEILAGALLEHHRAALVGTRTYGKGTVQKSYPLADGVNLKLTVARYILANERRITEAGLVPDVAVGQIRLDGSGVRYLDGWQDTRLAAPWEEIVPEVSESPGWRGRERELDLPLELARRAVASAEGSARERVLAELKGHAQQMRAEQEQELAQALAVKGIDWSPAPEDGTFPQASVDLTADPIGGDTYRLTVVVTNDGDTPLHRGVVQLTCPSFPSWDDRVIPVGRVRPGQTGQGELLVHLPPGIRPRVDEVSLRLRADRRPPLAAGIQILAAESRLLPALQVEAALVHRADAVGPHGHPVHESRVTVHNLAQVPIPGLEVHFGYPDDSHVELLDRAARAPHVDPRSEAELVLAMEVAPSAPLVLPMDLVVESDVYRTLAQWPLALPTTGDSVLLQAPKIEVRTGSAEARVAEDIQLPIVVTDDRAVNHVVVWVNGEKIAWMAGGGARVFLRPTIRLLPGDNRMVVETRDDQGIAAREVVNLLGTVVSPNSAADAGADD